MRRSRGAAIAACALPLAGAAPSLDPRHYEEPRDAEYWGQSSDATPPFQEERLQAEELSRESFNRKILDGRVFVVEDIGRDWPMAKWDCEYFRSDPTFSKAEMNQQYTSGSTGFVGFRSEWMATRTPSEAKDADAPRFAPYYWGIKDVQFADAARSRTWKLSMLKKVQEHVRLPPFMNSGNIRSFNTTPEFWFASAGAGAKAHMDSHVQATMSLQLAGTKRWRLGMMEARQAPFLAMIYRDGDVYEASSPWVPQFNFTLKQGQALFFPPGFVHETLNVDESCSASVTFQFSLPMASRLYRRFLPRVRRTADIHESWPLLAEWASLHGPAPKAGLDYQEARTLAMGASSVGASFKRADIDGDGRLTSSELGKAFGKEEALNLLGFHDLDEDGVIAREEFAEVFGLWAGTVKTVLAETPEKHRKFQLQDMVGGFNIEDLPPKTTAKLLRAARQLEAEKLHGASGTGEL